MSKKNLLISISSLTLLLIGLAVGLNLISQNQNYDKKAASPSGTATFKIISDTLTLWTGSTQTVSGILNLPEPILAYQIVAYLSYTTADPPALISGTSVTTTEPALNCFTNSISLNSDAKKYTLVIACGVPATTPPTTYTTNGIDKTMFTFNLQAHTPGTLTITIDPVNSIVNSSSVDANDILAIPAGSSFTIQEDTTPPAVISNLTTTNPSLNSITLNWSSPSDTGPLNKAGSYEIRYSTSAITPSNWTSATLVTNPPAPANANTAQTLTVGGLNSATTYYFGIKSKDANNNQSSLSNIASAATTNKGTLNFRLKFQGVNSAISGKTVNVILMQGATQTGSFNNVALTASGNVYSGSIPNIDGGTYDIYIKGPAHLRKKIPSITVSVAGTQNWPATPPTLLTGDIVQNNFVDASDYSTMLLTFNPILTQDSISDINFDNKVDSTDYSLMLLNFNPLVSGD